MCSFVASVTKRLVGQLDDWHQEACTRRNPRGQYPRRQVQVETPATLKGLLMLEAANQRRIHSTGLKIFQQFSKGESDDLSTICRKPVISA
jgi:hypothetical protein